MSRIPRVCDRCHGAKNLQVFSPRSNKCIIVECAPCKGTGVLYDDKKPPAVKKVERKPRHKQQRKKK